MDSSDRPRRVCWQPQDGKHPGRGQGIRHEHDNIDRQEKVRLDCDLALRNAPGLHDGSYFPGSAEGAGRPR